LRFQQNYFWQLILYPLAVNIWLFVAFHCQRMCVLLSFYMISSSILRIFCWNHNWTLSCLILLTYELLIQIWQILFVFYLEQRNHILIQNLNFFLLGLFDIKRPYMYFTTIFLINQAKCWRVTIFVWRAVSRTSVRI
jgi:hypothetical protein